MIGERRGPLFCSVGEESFLGMAEVAMITLGICCPLGRATVPDRGREIAGREIAERDVESSDTGATTMPGGKTD